MITVIIGVLIVLWLLGFFVVHIGGGLVHILLVIALIAFIYNMLTGRKAA